MVRASSRFHFSGAEVAEKTGPRHYGTRNFLPEDGIAFFIRSCCLRMIMPHRTVYTWPCMLAADGTPAAQQAHRSFKVRYMRDRNERRG
jgi:hypothetical protein